MPFMRSESCSFIWHPKVVTWYFMARFSRPRKLGPESPSYYSSSVVSRARLPDHGHLDLARIFELLLDLARDLVREQHGAVVVEGAGLHHHADLAARLHGVDLVDAVVAGGGVLEGAQAPDVLLERLPPGARGRAGERGGGPGGGGPPGLGCPPLLGG